MGRTVVSPRSVHLLPVRPRSSVLVHGAPAGVHDRWFFPPTSALIITHDVNPKLLVLTDSLKFCPLSQLLLIPFDFPQCSPRFSISVVVRDGVVIKGGVLGVDRDLLIIIWSFFDHSWDEIFLKLHFRYIFTSSKLILDAFSLFF